MKNTLRGGNVKKQNDGARLIIAATAGIIVGYLIGVNFPYIALSSSIYLSSDKTNKENQSKAFERNLPENIGSVHTPIAPQIYVPTNPRGAESLPPGIIDLKNKPRYLVTFTVGWDQRDNIDAAVKKFSEDFQILLFHYDGRTTEWDRYEWSKKSIHISVKRQTKWWYAKRFLHPDIVAAYDYIFIWDEDLGVKHFNGDMYMKLVKKHGLEISQPGLEPDSGLTWQMTKRRGDKEVHKDTEEKPGWCSDPNLPPCAAFVEIMAPVFSREAWRCVWHLIQNDLVHGWGLDFAFRRCVKPAHEKIGVVDSQWIVHQVIPSLGQVPNAEYGWQEVNDRCKSEWALFQDRLANADKVYLKESGRG
ncbi:uncharacterized protein LOC143578399 [Bidens hawaiensis]|uniref:uncharacterized protein LOC143578399 n=1 Tax=Bidens hawaiensis TaxID=980011 RepID=UPI00404A049C